VKAIAVGEDGTVYVGGNFTRMGPQTGGGVPVSATTGEPRARFPAVNGGVGVAVPDGSGGWYIGGQFSRAGGQPRANLAHVLADGTLDPAWTPSATFDGKPDFAGVQALARVDDVIYVSGGFNRLGGVDRGGLGAVDATGKVTDWAPTVGGIGVSCLLAHRGTIYLGGDFSEVNGEARMSLAAVDTSGALTVWNPGASSPYNYMDAMVSSLAIDGDTVLVGGWFSVVGGQPRTALAALDRRTGVPTSWAPNVELPSDPFGPRVNSLWVEDGTLYVGGTFAAVEGQARPGLAAFDPAGALTHWAPALDGRPVYSVSARGGTIYAAGAFRRVEGQARTHFAAFDLSGALTPWNPDPDENPWWGTLVAASGNTVYVGGTFRWLGSRTRRAGLAAVDPAGRVTDWNPGVTGAVVPGEGSEVNSGSVLALAVVRGTVYAGGTFTVVGGQPRSNLAAVDTSGVVTEWNPAPDGPVYAFEASETGLTIGGHFHRVGDVERTHLAAFDTSGRLTSWAPAPNAYVTALVRDGSTLYVGGYFNAIGNSARSTVAAFGADGTLLPWSPEITGTFASFALPSWSAPSINGVSRWIEASGSPGVAGIAARGGLVYLAGDFAQVGGVDRRGLAAVDSTGAPTPFHVEVPAASPENPVFPPRALQWGFDQVLAGATVFPFPGSTIPGTVLIADPRSPAQGSSAAIFAVPHDWYLSGGLVWELRGGWPLAEAVGVHGEIAYVGGAFRGIRPLPRWSLAAIGRDGGLTDWDPNAAP
jgi:trimeric autotransporter adhesin